MYVKTMEENVEVEEKFDAKNAEFESPPCGDHWNLLAEQLPHKQFPLHFCWDALIPLNWTFEELPISGAHNAHANEDRLFVHATDAVDHIPLIGELINHHIISPVMDGTFETQHWNTLDQGRRGVRFFDIDVTQGCQTYHFHRKYGHVALIMQRINMLLSDICPQRCVLCERQRR